MSEGLDWEDGCCQCCTSEDDEARSTVPVLRPLIPVCDVLPTRAVGLLMQGLAAAIRSKGHFHVAIEVVFECPKELEIDN
jgi:hypothetical protein